MKKYWDSIKMFTWAFAIFFIFTLGLIIQESVSPSVGANIGAGILALFIVLPICAVLLALGTYRAMKIYFHKPTPKPKRKSKK